MSCELVKPLMERGFTVSPPIKRSDKGGCKRTKDIGVEKEMERKKGERKKEQKTTWKD
jgi:hypothetical protein